MGGMGRSWGGDLVIIRPNRFTAAVTAGTAGDQGRGRPRAGTERPAVLGESCGTGGTRKKSFKKPACPPAGAGIGGGGFQEDRKRGGIHPTRPGDPEGADSRSGEAGRRDHHIPKIKTHDQIPMSGALKNMKGAPGREGEATACTRTARGGGDQRPPPSSAEAGGL